MNLKTLSMMGALLLLAGTGANAQKKKEVLNDSNTPLHLLQPAYKVPYGMLTTEEIKADMDRVLRYLEKNTPTRVVDKNTGKVITDYANMTADAQLERGAFRLASYEWGVTYSAMLAAAEATGDQAYYKYVTDRFQFLAEVAPHFRKVLEKYGTVDPQMKQILTPHALDDAGAVCAAMVKVQMKKNSPELKPLIDNYMDFIVNKEYRLADGTFARTRPQHNTLWLDDMFMGIPPIAWYSCIAGDKQQAYLSEAVRQIFQFADRMYGEDGKEAKAKEYKHMTFTEAAQLAKNADVREMWLTHYSPSLVRPQDYVDKARKIFPATIAANDGRTVELKFDDEG